ncbi:hypothetical protein [uncultured Empedobacter sp.]|uniref:hypothetical protein n=1 Tax=uncultured Empedobacter sp. TaxID=410844 RepID=UPI002629CE10|nr:hypothetical protein [uncultured Empedobacter sp.]
MQEIYIVEPSTSEEAKALRAFAKALKIKITKQNNLDSIDNFELSKEQKKILDSQKDLPLSEYKDNIEFLAELKSEYGL